MRYAWIVALSLVAFGGTILAADATSAAPAAATEAAPPVAPAAAPEAAPAVQEKAEVDWVLRSQATTKLLEFLFAIRKEAKKTLDFEKAYIQSTGRWNDYLAANLDVKDSAARRVEALGLKERLADVEVLFPDEKLTVDQLIEMAEGFVKFRGYEKGVVDDPDEIAKYKQMAQSQKVLIQQTARAIDIGFKEVMRMYAYLEATNSVNGFRAYVVDQRETAKKRATDLAMQEGQMQREAFRAKTAQFQRNYDRFLGDAYRYQGSGTDYYDNN